MGKKNFDRWRRYLGIAGILAVAFMFVDNPLGAGYFLGNRDNVELFCIAALAAAATSCLLCAGRGVLSGWNPHGTVNVGALMALGGMVGGWISQIANLPEVAFAVFGLAFGAGCGYTAIRWGSVFSGLDERGMIRCMGAAGIIAALLKLLGFVAEGGFPLLSAVILACALVMTLVVPARQQELSLRELKPGDTVLDRSRKFAAQNWKIIAGLLVCIYILAATLSAFLSGRDISNNYGYESIGGNAIGFLVASIMLFAMANRAPWFTFRILYQLAPIVCVSTLLLGWLLGVSGGSIGRYICSIPLGFSLSVMSILFWVRLVLTGDELAPAFAFGSTAVLFVAFFLFVVWMWPIAGDGLMNSVSLSFMVVFLAIVGMERTFRSYSDDSGEPWSSSADFEAMIDERCLSIAEASQLSKREAQILRLLAQGRSAPFIAEELFVSANTVKTHIKRIYTKTEVHSRDELLDLIHDVSKRLNISDS